MSRKARIKNESYKYHIMCRSISEVKLFKDNQDKEKYMDILKRYKDKFLFKLYDYCLMGNHVHLMICPNGADLSKIMQGINLSYVLYFNRKYKRVGHLFQERFKSKVLVNDLYSANLSAYIHRNPREYKKYRNSPEKYPYSALGVYLGIRKDKRGLIDTDYVLRLFGSNKEEAIRKHMNCVMKYIPGDKKAELDYEQEFEEFDLYEYIDEKHIIPRNKERKQVIDFVANELKVDSNIIFFKNARSSTAFRAISIFFMRSFCGYSLKEICKFIGNITLSRVSQMCSYAVELLRVNNQYREMIVKFLAV